MAFIGSFIKQEQLLLAGSFVCQGSVDLTFVETRGVCQDLKVARKWLRCGRGSSRRHWQGLQSWLPVRVGHDRYGSLAVTRKI